MTGGTFRNCCCNTPCAAFGCASVPRAVRVTFGAGWTYFGSPECVPPNADYIPGEYLLETLPAFGEDLPAFDGNHCCLLALRLETWPDLVRYYEGVGGSGIFDVPASSPAWLLARFTADATTVTLEVWLAPEQSISSPTPGSPQIEGCWAEYDAWNDNAGFCRIYAETRNHPAAEPFECSGFFDLPPGTPTVDGVVVSGVVGIPLCGATAGTLTVEAT